MTCEFKLDGRRCVQPAEALGLCAYHLRIGWIHVVFRRPLRELLDRYYNDKIMSGLIEPSWHTFRESEVLALLWGKYKGDGRKTDQWTILEDEL